MSFALEIPYNYRYNNGSIVQLYNGQRDYHFYCSALGYPKLQVTWKRNGTEILETFDSNTRVFQQKEKINHRAANSTLCFKEVYVNDAGVYTCESFIEGHDYIATDYVNVEVICK